MPIRFWLLQAGTLGLAGTLLADLPWQAPFAALLLVAIVWQAWGPVRAFVTGRAREWEVVPLVILVGAAAVPWCINTGKSLIPLTLRFFAQKRNLLIPLELSRVMHQGRESPLPRFIES